MNPYSQSYYLELQRASRALLNAVADQLPVSQAQLIGELIDANESGVALEEMSGMLIASSAKISSEFLRNYGELVRGIGLDEKYIDRLRALVSAESDGLGNEAL